MIPSEDSLQYHPTEDTGPKDAELPYIHASLAEDKEHIRLLILDPGHEGDRLRGSLRAVKLGEELYEAISYVWGSDNRDQDIVLDGRRMSITTSMAESLRQTRHIDKPRTLWADSICIDQTNNIEKGHQVVLMGRIYETSQQTLICLGNSSQTEHRQAARNVAALIDTVNNMLDGVFNAAGFSWEWHSFPYRVEHYPGMLADETWDSWVELGRCNWFCRGWVIQEVALARKALLLWAGAEIQWSKIVRTQNWLVRRDPFHLKIPRIAISPLHLQIWRNGHQPEHRTLVLEAQSVELNLPKTLWVLHAARQLELTVPKDRIYAFMGVPTSDRILSKIQLQPDYRDSKSHLGVYNDFAVAYLEETSDLDLLFFVHHRHDEDEDDHDGATKSLEAASPGPNYLPSWVPRWDYTGSDVEIVHHEADLKIYQDAAHHVQDGSTLHVKGIIIDAVEFVSGGVKGVTEPSETLCELVAIWRKFATQSIKLPHQTPFQKALAFLSTVNTGSFVGEYEEWHLSMAAFARILEDDHPGLPVDTKNQRALHVSQAAIPKIMQRQCVMLGRGYFGIAPPTTRPGDLCAVIFGTTLPFIIREVTLGRYKLVGWASIQSKQTNKDGLSYSMGRDARCYDWEEWGLPTQNIVFN